MGVVPGRLGVDSILAGCALPYQPGLSWLMLWDCDSSCRFPDGMCLCSSACSMVKVSTVMGPSAASQVLSMSLNWTGLLARASQAQSVCLAGLRAPLSSAVGVRARHSG